MPPHPHQQQDMPSPSTSSSPSCSTPLHSPMPRLPSVQEGLEMLCFPRLPSVTDGLYEFAPDLSIDEAALFTAAGNMDIKMVEEILNRGVDVNFTSPSISYRSVLHEVVVGCILQTLFESHKKQHLRFIDMLTLLIHHGADVNAVDLCRRSALHIAASYPGQKDMIKVLLASGAKANMTDMSRQSPLHKAALRAAKEDVQALLDGGADPNLLDSAFMSPIHLAAKRKFHSATLSLLLHSGGRANVRDESRGTQTATPLHVAAKIGFLDNVRVLLGAGALVKLKDSSGQSALHIAAANDLTGKIVSCLLKHGSDVNEQDATFGETPLHKAVRCDMIENFKILARSGANPNIQDCQLETVLHKAASCSKPFTWTCLMKVGGKVNMRNSLGLSVLEKAEKARNHIAVGIMRESRGGGN